MARDDTDPWLADRLAASEAFTDAETRVEAAISDVIQRWLAAVRRLVLGADTLTAASAPDLGGFAGADPEWQAALQAIAVPALEDLFSERFLAVARTATISAQPYREAYIAEVFSRLRLFPAEQFEEIRPELAEAISSGEDADGVRARIEAILDFDSTAGARGDQAETRRLKARINQIERQLDQGGVTQDQAAELRAERSRLYPELYASQRRWQWKARRITRTETVGAMNGGAYYGAVARAEILGETLYKQWLATDDERTRLTHRAADGQVRPLTTPFVVGGFPLLFPGDPTGPGHETINCRCTQLVVDREDLDPDQLAELDQAGPDGADLDVDQSLGVDGLDVTDHDDGEAAAVADLAVVAQVPEDLSPYTLLELADAYGRLAELDEAGSLRILERLDELEQLANADQVARADDLVEAMVEAADVEQAVEQTGAAWGAVRDVWHTDTDSDGDEEGWGNAVAPWEAYTEPPEPLTDGPGYRYDPETDTIVEDLDVPGGWVASEDPYTGAVSYYEREGIPAQPAKATRLAAAKAAYADWVHVQYLAAEEATRGVMMSKAGIKAGIPERALWSGNARTARAYASEEMLRWWQDHPRLTQVEWLYQELGDERYREAALKARENNAKILGSFALLDGADRRPFIITREALLAAARGRGYSRAELARVWMAGLDAGRRDLPLTDCPYRPTADGLLCLLWVRAWASQRPDTVIASGGDAMADDENTLPNGWRGVLGPLDVLTGDDRILATPPDGVRYRSGTLVLQWQKEAGQGHDGAVLVARIDRAWTDTVGGRSVVMGEGPFDLAGADGAEAARLLRDGFLTGASIDPDEVTVEWAWADTDGNRVDPEQLGDDDELWEMYEAGLIKEIMIMTDWRLMGATLTVYPAFDEARIEPLYDYTPSAEGITAAGPGVAVDDALAPTRLIPPHPAEHYADPQLERLTPLTVTDDGRVYGHIAGWGQCHIGFGDMCVMAPRSRTDYAHFHLGEVITTEGRLAVGKLTLGGGHADPKLGYRAAVEHYDDVATAIAAVRAGEDKWGIWVAGRILSSATPEDLERFMLCPPSGDWRRIGGHLELVAACAVNVPGFQSVRTMAASAGGVQTSLVAAGYRDVRRLARRANRRRGVDQVDPRTLALDIARQVRAFDQRAARAERLAARIGRDEASRVATAAARINR